MTDKFVDSIYEDTKDFRDPVTNLHLDHNNNNINVVCKDGKVNISLNIDSKFKKKYQDLIVDLKKTIQQLDNIISVIVLEKFLVPSA